MLSVRAAEFCEILYFGIYLCITPAVRRDGLTESKQTASGGVDVHP